MQTLKKLALLTGLLLLICLGISCRSIFNTSNTDNTERFNQFIGFGDSNLDTGYFRYHTTSIPAYDSLLSIAISKGAKGGFAGNGVMCSTILAERFALSAATIDDGDGSNYAIGGSYAAITKGTLISAVQQIQNYLSSVNGKANPDALYIIKSGDNDLTFVSNQTEKWREDNPNYLSNQASTLAEEIKILQLAGARTIIVPNSGNYAWSAALGGEIDPNNDAKYKRSLEYGKNLWSDLTTIGVDYIPADIDSLMKSVVKNPILFGFTETSVLAENAPSEVSALISIITPSEHQNFLFIDGAHFTTAGQTIVADYEYNLLMDLVK